MSEEKREINKQGSVPNEQPTPAYQLTKLELKRRLKHIAGLCYSLVCDISNVEIEAEQLRAENEYLRRKLGKEKHVLTDEQRIRKSEYYRRRYAAKIAAETPEEREKRLAEAREYSRKWNAKKKAQNAARNGEDGKPEQDA